MEKHRAGRGASAPPAADEPDTRDETRESGSFPIVGIGASAGGLEAFSALLKHLPPDTGMAFVLVQHLDPVHESALVQLLGRETSLPVHEVTNNLRVEPNHVYVIPPNTNLSIRGGVLVLLPRQQTRTPTRSIDLFFEALAQDQHERAIGVVLSGTATDGTLGLEAIKAEDGITFAQDESARYDSMPRSAMAAGCVDFVLSPPQIASELARIAQHPAFAGSALGSFAPAEDDRASATAYEDDESALPSGGRGTPRTGATHARAEASRGRVGQPGKEADTGFKKILLLLRNHSGVDFSLYKSSTIQRRIARRLVLNKHNTPEQYAQFLRGNTTELNALYSDALISVTSFFRNPDAFEVLQRTVWPALLQRHGDDPVRVWVLGCSTGQEAYSTAMAFVEAAEQSPRARKLQVFATDLNDALLDKARNGLYDKSLAQDLSPERLRRFFVEEEGGYRVSKPLREMVVFARQNVISDPPFSRMDLISCRNLLIYFEPSLQKKVFPVFHYALGPAGFLYLGASESIGGFTDLFEPVDKKHKIYVKKAAPTPAFQTPAKQHGDTPTPRSQRPGGSRQTVEHGEMADGVRAELSAEREADRVAVSQFAPPGVLINADLQILQFRGATSPYLTPPAGKATFDILKMARPGLMLPLRAAINEAKKDNKTTRKEQVRIEHEDGRARSVHVEVIPLKNLRERCFLIVFEDADELGRRRPPAPSGAIRVARGADTRRVAELEREVAETRDYLQSIQEQHEAANEELQASNEEVQSANEELQSINEELETSKEELESANEELTTVNEEMANRNAELQRLNNDLINVQTSAQIPIVLVGRDLAIRRFSVQAEKQFNLLAADVGRPIGSVRHALDVPDLESFVTDVIDTVRAAEREVRDKDGRWCSLRVRPYLTLDNKVDGAVLALVDITELKRTEQAIAASREYADAILRTTRDPLLVLNADLRVDTANEAFYRTFQVSEPDVEGRLVSELGDRQWDLPALRELLEGILPRNNVFNEFAVTHTFERLGPRTMVLNARRLNSAEGQSAQILLGIQDVTEAFDVQAEIRASRARYQALVGASAQIVWTTDATGAVVEDSPSWSAFTGDTLDASRGFGWLDALHPDDRERVSDLWRRAVAERTPMATEYRMRHISGEWRWADVRAMPVLNGDGSVREWVGMNSDITERKKYEETLRASDQQKTEFLALLAHELRNPLAPICNSLEIMRRAKSSAPRRATPSQEAEGHRPVPNDHVDAAADVLERQVAQMVRLVDDLLDAGRISRGKLDLRRERVELSSVVHHAVEAVRPLCESLNQELTVTLPPIPTYLNADRTRLAQIVGNLLNNASKFSPIGERIWLTVERGDDSTAEDGQTDRDQRGPDVLVRVRDMGIGIAAEQLPRVFDMFAQVDTALERSRSGLGIGLTLVRTLVHLHGGTVDVISAGLGKGSEFVVRLPTIVDPPAPEAPSPRGDAEATTALRILVVDDNLDSADSMALLLQMRGHEVHMAHDGLTAVEAAGALQPDVILLDIGLPDLNGYAAARRIREQPREKRLILVAVTGWGEDEDRRRSAEAGFDAHMVKPVNDAVVMKVLAGLGVGKQDRDN